MRKKNKKLFRSLRDLCSTLFLKLFIGFVLSPMGIGVVAIGIAFILAVLFGLLGQEELIHA